MKRRPLKLQRLKQMQQKNSVVIGRLGDAHGLHGALHLISYTDPADAIFQYKNWMLAEENKTIQVTQHQTHGDHFLVQLQGVTDRDQALLLKHRDIVIDRSALPPLKSQQYYWADLIGLTVINAGNKTLGKITSLFETGSNDVIVVKGEKEMLIPYLSHVILSVDLTQKIMRVDWDAI